MSAKKEAPRLGPTIRKLREAREISLRDFARKVGKSPTYISFMEREELKTPPREDVIRSIARELEADEDELLAMAGRISKDLSDTIVKRPKEMAAFLRVARDLSADDIEKLTDEARKKHKSASTKRR